MIPNKKLIMIDQIKFHAALWLIISQCVWRTMNKKSIMNGLSFGKYSLVQINSHLDTSVKVTSTQSKKGEKILLIAE